MPPTTRDLIGPIVLTVVLVALIALLVGTAAGQV
jgi:hypothetical protein